MFDFSNQPEKEVHLTAQAKLAMMIGIDRTVLMFICLSHESSFMRPPSKSTEGTRFQSDSIRHNTRRDAVVVLHRQLSMTQVGIPKVLDQPKQCKVPGTRTGHYEL
jgi:hypothetical protein